MELLLTISDVVLAVRVYVAEALPVALILGIQADDVAPAAKPPCKPIATEEEACKVRDTISAQGYRIVLEEAQHGAHDALMNMDDVIVKLGTKITVYLLSSVAPGVSIGYRTAPFTHSKPIPVTVLNMSNEYSSSKVTQENEVASEKKESAQMIEDKLLLKQLNDRLQQIEATIKYKKLRSWH
eukprot:6822-Heterococcus_DN1.PRE.3